MASKIQGITIKIAGDTSELTKSLAKVESKIKENNEALKVLEKNLKIDPSNIVFLTEKEKLLKEQTELLNQKMGIMKDVQKDALGDLPNNAKLTTAQMAQLDTEIASTDRELGTLKTETDGTSKAMKDVERNTKLSALGFSTLDKAAKDSSKDIKATGEESKKSSENVKKFGEAAKKAGEIAAKAFAAALTACTAGIATFAKASISAGMDFDKAMSQVQATMGATKDEMAQLREFAQHMGATTAFSATQAAQALNYMALAGYDSEKSMKMLPTVLNLAAAGSIDLASASDMVTDAQSALNLTEEETIKLVDQMAKTSQKSNTSVAQLGEGMLKIGATARKLKGGTAELSTLLGILADNGIKGAEGGTHLRNMIISLTKPTDSATVALKKLKISVYDSKGEMRSMTDIIADLNAATKGMSSKKKDSYINAIFNKGDLAAVNALLGTSKDRVNQLMTEIQNASGGTTFSDATKDVNDFSKAVEDGTDNVTGLKGATDDASKSIANLTSGDKSIDTKGLDTLGSSIDDLKTKSDDATKSMQGTQGAAAEMANTQLDNLSGDVTMFKSALEGLQITISDACTPTLREFVQMATDGLQKITQGFKEGGLEGGFNAFTDWLSGAVGKIVEMVPVIVQAAGKLLAAVVKGFMDNADTIINGLTKLIQDAADWLMADGNVQKVVNSIIQITLKLVNAFAKLLPIIIPAIVKIIVEICKALTSEENVTLLIDAVLNLIGAVIVGLANGFAELVAGFADIFGNLVNLVADFFEWIVPIAADGVGGIVEAVQGYFNMILQHLAFFYNAFKEGCAAIIDFFVKGWQGLVMLLSQGVTNVKNFFVNLGTGVKTTVLDMWNNVKNFFANGITAITTGVENVKNKVVNFITSLVDNIKELPSKIVSVGENLVKGLWNGIKNMTSWIIDKVKGFGDSVINGLKKFFKIQSPSRVFAEIGEYCAAGLGLGFDEGLNDAIDEMEDASTKAINGVMNAFDDPIQTDLSNSFEVAKQSASKPQIDYSGGLSKIESAIMASAASSQAVSNGGQIVIPVYIGQEHIDTLVVDAFDRYNYKTGGH